ncbi:MAG: VWA domain-containing protein, partial [Fimbriimonadaceae bacterium]|nr:VWA domain-containing protein [Alphaproteobacteria bacterium]
MPQSISGKKIADSLRRTAVFFVAAMALVSTAVAQERTMIVLDGSGSMWGQIDGKPKLEIARETLRQVLQGVPDSTELGLMAYGHREKGNCNDIELIVSPAQGTAAQIADKVDNLRFLGKTPLSAAVQAAAEEMRYTEDKATVVLITDGIETCGVDVCAIGNQLESLGVDFTAHVVGFGLSAEEGAQVACLAENTGGQYFSANDGESLVEALNETVVAVPPKVTFVARDQDDNNVDTIALDWLINDADGNKVFQANGKTTASGTLTPGDYTVMVSGVDV